MQRQCAKRFKTEAVVANGMVRKLSNFLVSCNSSLNELHISSGVFSYDIKKYTVWLSITNFFKGLLEGSQFDGID